MNYAKFLSFIGIVLAIGSSKENLGEKSLNLRKIHEIICSAKCSDNEIDQRCGQSCLEENISISWSEDANGDYRGKITVLCQEVYYVKNTKTVGIYLHLESSGLTVNSGIFIVEERKNGTKWEFSDWTLKENIFVKDLLVSEVYQFRVTLVRKSGKIIKQFYSGWFKTYQDSRRTLSPPTSAKVTDFSPKHLKTNAILSWFPPADRFCSYDIYWFTSKSGKLGHKIIFIMDTEEPLETEINGLLYGANYTVTISSMITETEKSEDPLKIFFVSPKCLLFNKYNFSICPPGKVTNMTALINVQNNAISVDVQWEKPNHYNINNQILGYEVQIRRVIDILKGSKIKLDSRNVNLKQNETSAIFKNLIEGSQYIIKVIAVSMAGIGENTQLKVISPKFAVVKKIISVSEGDVTEAVTAGIGGSIFIILIIITVVLISRRKRNKSEKYKEYKGIGKCTVESSKIVPLNMSFPSEKNNYEVDRRRIVKGKTIGEGSCGIVHQGHLIMKNYVKIVAIKSLKAAANVNNRQDLSEEIELLKSVGKHEHIVNIIACCTTTDDICFLMEYCPYGDLRTYLQMARMSGEITLMDGRTEQISVSYYDMVSYARQVAMGMDYLSSNKIVHRDLAARNILVKNKKIVKITDFGLAKDIYEEGIFEMEIGPKRLPIRWMAIESVFQKIYTTKSDVWSFGILLWEMTSFGATPYPGVIGVELLPLLKTGHRLGKPKDCIDEMYDIMTMCWKEDARIRPTFSKLQKLLENIIECTITYIDF